MAKKRIAIAIYLSIGIIIFAFSALLFYKYIRRWVRIDQKRTILKQTQQALADFKQLGFSQDSELINLLQGRLQRTQDEIEGIQKQWLAFYAENHRTPLDTKSIKDVMSLNKKMLSAYMKDINEYRKLGIENTNPIIKFSYDKVIRLTIALAELERHLNGTSSSTHHEYIKRLERMRDINEESIAQFKNDLVQFTTQGLPLDNPKVAFIQTQITRKTRALHSLEEMLKKY